MDFWSQTAARGSPILEFPYRGDSNDWSSYPQQSSFDLSHHSSFYPGIGQNAVVYQVPGLFVSSFRNDDDLDVIEICL